MTAETRQRVRQTAWDMGLRPNALAQSLVRRRRFTVYDWDIMAAATRAPLTSIDRSPAALGREAGLTSLALAGGQSVELGLHKRPCRLVVRESCGAGLGYTERIAATG